MVMVAVVGSSQKVPEVALTEPPQAEVSFDLAWRPATPKLEMQLRMRATTHTTMWSQKRPFWTMVPVGAGLTTVGTQSPAPPVPTLMRLTSVG